MQARDQHCRFPGCTTSAYHCDLDHVRPWLAGATTPANLALLCRRHHRVKQRPGWTARLRPDATMDWTDPAGGTRTTFPVDHLGSTLPENSPATGHGAVDLDSDRGFGDQRWSGDYQDANAYTGGLPIQTALQLDLNERIRARHTVPSRQAHPPTGRTSPLEAPLLDYFPRHLDRPRRHRDNQPLSLATDMRWLSS